MASPRKMIYDRSRSLRLKEGACPESVVELVLLCDIGKHSCVLGINSWHDLIVCQGEFFVVEEILYFICIFSDNISLRILYQNWWYFVCLGPSITIHHYASVVTWRWFFCDHLRSFEGIHALSLIKSKWSDIDYRAQWTWILALFMTQSILTKCERSNTS